MHACRILFTLTTRGLRVHRYARSRVAAYRSIGVHRVNVLVRKQCRSFPDKPRQHVNPCDSKKEGEMGRVVDNLHEKVRVSVRLPPYKLTQVAVH